MAANVETFGADREDIHSLRFKRYKAVAGKTDRVGIIGTDPKKLFKGVKAHFKEGVGFFCCKSTKTVKEVCCTHSYEKNRPTYRIGCVIIVYDLVTIDGKVKLKGYELLPWVFGEKMYNKLAEIDKEYPLLSHDLKLTLAGDPKYQDLTALNCKDSIWNNNPDLKAKVLKEAEVLIQEMADNLASDKSVTEIKEALAIDSPGSQDAATDVNLETVIDSI